MLSRKAVVAVAALSLAGSHARGVELVGFEERLGFGGEARFVAPDLGGRKAAAPPAALPRWTSPSAAADGSGALRLAWLDPASAAGRSALAAREEAARVFKALGVAVSWRRAEPSEPARPGEVRVILLDRQAVNDGGRANVLGSTPARFEGSPFVWIHVPGVRDSLGLPGSDPGPAGDARESYLVGVALGRVIAHELVHALAPRVPHGEGLMKSRLTRRDLTATTAPVTPGLAARVRAALGADPGPAPSDTGLLAAEHARGEQQR